VGGGNAGLREVRAVAVENWLRTLPIAKGTKSKVRNLAEELLTWRRTSPYNQPEDWIVARMRKKGKQSYSPDAI
jgi:integrase